MMKYSLTPALISTLPIQQPQKDIIAVEVIGEEAAGEDKLELLEGMTGEGHKRHGRVRKWRLSEP